MLYGIINDRFFDKENLKQLFYYQSIPIYILYVFGALLTYKKQHPILTVACISFLTFYSYIIHVAIHQLPDHLNIHMLFHHDNNIIHPDIGLCIEFIYNVLFFVFFYYMQMLSGIKYVPDILIFYYGVVYISIHMVNYSIFSVRNHTIHHSMLDKKVLCNYSPDIFDHYFGTNYDECYEDFSHFIPNLVVAFLITYYVFGLYRD